MDQKIRDLCDNLIAMESQDAARWLINNFPAGSQNSGYAFQMIGHRSWRRADQKILATHYLSTIPFANSRGYEVFASFMSVGSLLSCIKPYIPKEEVKLDLLRYNLLPVLLKSAKNEKDRSLITKFFDDLQIISRP
ncbi:hypothetical protein ACQR53_21355 [Xanthomonas oryzae]|uniref:hypothetical protein n=1 Tax=Xanthomonas oryzae TaxID=347 RepID=UPI000B689E62|nr:hypothetical protein [Xanthomonas oryzae]OWB26300.1 hypothetical protein XocBAI20_15455 [Xanthomonas oryzae pv. oryzicola]QBG89864.1 hypothetical protein EYC54_22460 [Xanthomonas oryzae]QBH01353.1 hypothetical protein EYC56_21410 [Xanthomonas oryzae]